MDQFVYPKKYFEHIAKANANYSHSEGSDTIANGIASHSEGYYTESNGNYSHAEGQNTIATGRYSHVEGYYTVANNNAEHASGIYNKSTTSTDASKATHFSIGIGTSDTDRKNAFEVKQNGDIYIEGVEGRIQDKLNNLYIDPVVWKYLANPFIIRIEDGKNYVPEELVGSPVNSADIPEIKYEWKYLNPAMYIGYNGMTMQYDTVILSEDTGHMALKIFDHDIYIGENFKILYE